MRLLLVEPVGCVGGFNVSVCVCMRLNAEELFPRMGRLSISLRDLIVLSFVEVNSTFFLSLISRDAAGLAAVATLTTTEAPSAFV